MIKRKSTLVRRISKLENALRKRRKNEEYNPKTFQEFLGDLSDLLDYYGLYMYVDNDGDSIAFGHGDEKVGNWS